MIYKVKLVGNDGKNYVITYESLWGQLKECMTYEEKIGWNTVSRSLRKDIDELKDTLLSEILIPKAKTEILKFLKENSNVQTRNFYHKAWNHGERLLAWYHGKEELELEGQIVSVSHGKGKNRTWKLKEV